MRVLYLTMNPNRASTTVPTEGWFRVLRPLGLEPVLVSSETGAFHAWAIGQGISAYHVSLPFPNKWNPFPFAKSLWRLSRLVKRHGIQLIHCNEQNIYPVGQRLARLCGLPVVVSIHFTMDRGFCAWAFGGKKQPDRIFFISPGNLEACRPGVEGVISPERWRLLFNGLDLDHFCPDDSRRQSFRAEYKLGDGPLIGVACALRERKQLEHFFEAACHLPPKVKVVVAGGPVPDEREYAQAVIGLGKANLGDRLIHVGHLDELRGLYNALDLFVNTSREEACSISVLEAMACGCPVIGYPSKSVDGQVLPDGGEIVEQDDTMKLSLALQNWLNDPARMAEGRRGARRRVETDFDIRKLSRQLWSEYQDVLLTTKRKPQSRIPILDSSAAC
ncbi:MAG TPA: glycosyltransferase family 4 protein [Gemmataceae bacterium]|nr:glycosyltransferase family 4 protein [Gemmataceae bacterium]